MTSVTATARSVSPHRKDDESYRLALPDTARPAGIARRFVTSLLVGTPHDGIVDDARLCVSEVVANAHRHTRTSVIRAHVTVGPGQVTVSVSDDKPQTVPAAGGTCGADDNQDAQEGGWGLFLLEELAVAWGSDVCGCCTPPRPPQDGVIHARRGHGDHRLTFGSALTGHRAWIAVRAVSAA